MLDPAGSSWIKGPAWNWSSNLCPARERLSYLVVHPRTNKLRPSIASTRHCRQWWGHTYGNVCRCSPCRRRELARLCGALQLENCTHCTQGLP